MKKYLTPHSKTDFSGIRLFLWPFELKFLCGLGGKNVFKILVLELRFFFWLNCFLFSDEKMSYLVYTSHFEKGRVALGQLRIFFGAMANQEPVWIGFSFPGYPWKDFHLWPYRPHQVRGPASLGSFFNHQGLDILSF
jgi:hypothetical protein